MDAVKYLETRKRMSLSGDLSLVHLMEDAVDPEVLVREVERWSASHPLETRQSVFLKHYPEASISEHGVLLVCPCPKHYCKYPNGLCYLHTKPKTNARVYSGEAVCVEPDDFCSYGERKDEADAEG